MVFYFTVIRSKYLAGYKHSIRSISLPVLRLLPVEENMRVFGIRDLACFRDSEIRAFENNFFFQVKGIILPVRFLIYSSRQSITDGISKSYNG